MGNTGIYDTGVRPAIDKHLLELAQQRRDYGNYWSASSAGYCMRKVIFDRLQVPQTSEDARKQRVFTSGHIFHDWIQGITKAAGVSIAQEVELIDDSIMVKGHFDDLVLIRESFDDQGGYDAEWARGGSEENLILYDYKTQNSRAFTWQKKQGTGMSYFHRLQLGTYLYMLRRWKDTYADDKLTLTELDQIEELTCKGVKEARILKISKDDLRMSEELLFWDKRLESDVKLYWLELNAWWGRHKVQKHLKHPSAQPLPPCTCADHEGGFMAKPAYNPYFYEDEPCSLAWYEKCKQEGLIKI